MNKIVIIQCSNSKHDKAGSFGNGNIKIVANPQDKLSFRPDDFIPTANITWRQYLVQYNKGKDNLYNLFEAGKLYKNKIYEDIISVFGKENVFILSAGWGLIRSDFLIPKYNITFSNSALKEFRRKKKDQYNDFNHLANLDYCNDLNKEIHFFGGNDYLFLLYKLTKSIVNNIIIHYASQTIEKHPEYKYVKYPRCFTNWQYCAIKDFIRSV